MPLQQTSGNVTADAFGGGVAAVPNYIEDVFSTYLYTGNGSTQTITNGIDLAGKGGLVWLKDRTGTTAHQLFDTSRGVEKVIYSNLTNAQATAAESVTSFNLNGFTVGQYGVNSIGQNPVAWVFRRASKFFDVVTWTGNGANRTIAHNLGSVPGMIIVKRTDTTGAWQVYHRSLLNTEYLVLNTNAIAATSATRWNSTTPTSTVFSLGTDATVNASGGTYIAYIFAHNAGGFGLTGTDNVISCGSYVGDGNTDGPSIALGFEPQFMIVRPSDTESFINWNIGDTMRGLSVIRGFNNAGSYLSTNTPSIEATVDRFNPTATGFKIGDATASVNSAGTNYIYIAIRRGPMKVPTDGTKVYNAIARTGTGADATVTGVGFPPDMSMTKRRNGISTTPALLDRLRGAPNALRTTSTAAEVNDATIATSFNMDGITFGTDTGVNASTFTYINHFFRRAPSFFDEVCYTGTGVARTVAHNLTVVPELIIVKSRTGIQNWSVYSATLGNANGVFLNLTAASGTNGDWNSTTPTASVFSLVGTSARVNDAAATYVAYLFATCPGVSKVGSYTGNGTTQTIDCGFAAGARFVLLKRTDSTGGWYVYDTARGMTTLTDPYLFLNSTAAEVATLGSVTTVATGFALNSAILAAINVSGGTYIFLAIA